MYKIISITLILLLGACAKQRIETKNNDNAKVTDSVTVTQDSVLQENENWVHDFILGTYHNIDTIFSAPVLNPSSGSVFSYFITKNQQRLKASIIKDEMISFTSNKSVEIYVRHWEFNDSVNAKYFSAELRRRFDGEGIPLKEPNRVYVSGYGLYIFYVDAEAYREDLNSVVKFLISHSRTLLKIHANIGAPEAGDSLGNDKQQKGLAPWPIYSFRNFVGAFYNFILENLNRSNLTEADWSRTIAIRSELVGAKIRKLSLNERQAMMAAGRQATLEFLERGQKK